MLIKVKKILIDESDTFSELPDGNLHGENTKFIINTNEDDIVQASNESYN